MPDETEADKVEIAPESDVSEPTVTPEPENAPEDDVVAPEEVAPLTSDVNSDPTADDMPVEDEAPTSDDMVSAGLYITDTALNADGGYVVTRALVIN